MQARFIKAVALLATQRDSETRVADLRAEEVIVSYQYPDQRMVEGVVL